MPLINADQFKSFSASATNYLTTEVAQGYTLEEIHLLMGGGTPATRADITRLQVKLGANRKPIVDLTGAQLQSIGLYEDRPQAATNIVIPFTSVNALRPEDKYMGAIDFGALNIRQLSIEITLNGTPVNPTCTPRLLLGNSMRFGYLPDGTPDPRNFMFRALLNTPIVFSGAVSRKAETINTNANGGALLRRLHLFNTGDFVTSFEHKRRSTSVYEDIPLAQNNSFLDEQHNSPQANCYTYDVIYDHVEGRAYPQVESVNGQLAQIPQQFLFTTSGGGTVTAIADIHTTLDSL